MNLPKRLELLLYTVLAFPKASMMGLQTKDSNQANQISAKGLLLIPGKFHPDARPRIKSHTEILFKFCKYTELFASSNNRNHQMVADIYKTGIKLAQTYSLRSSSTTPQNLQEYDVYL